MSTSKVAANQAEQAKSQMGKISKEVKVPNEIKESEAHLYHVLMVEPVYNQSKLEVVFKSKIQMFNKRSWLSIKGRLKQIGVTHAYIIHNPTIKEGESKREALLREAKSKGYEGALNVKNAILEAFIKEAK